ncbi:class I SAM-dependent methyltransferase [Candidatus Venteria ishoeyi]|uniref:O-methyltransferase n=1 Tax=Candidatus Venteria ishoeyi TaxID=1899563 RepID=A0A1H6FBF5_9GAMM|nr:class I SAM-dependent methyltransferase [Candidatus Venteria ishoeyi]SEH06711.1 O-methyltransferase [Candidatus Venteria ishoeyi]
MSKLRRWTKKLIPVQTPYDVQTQATPLPKLMDNEFYLTEVIAEMDQLPCAHPASVNQDVANTYFALTKMWRPLLVIEIGCFIGFSTQHFAEALRRQGFGKIISIDAFDWDVEISRGMENRQNVAEYYRRKAGAEDIITFIKGYSTEIYPQIQAQLQCSIDLLYIDGDHCINGAFADFNTYYNDVRVGGHIILHDIYPSMCGVDGPRVLIDTLRQHNFVPHCIQVMEMNTRDGFGICVLRKVSGVAIQLPIPEKPPTFPSTPSPFPISFKITDAKTGQPVENALLECPQRFNEQRNSDANGYIELAHYLPNRYLVNISAKGYSTQGNVLVNLSHAPLHLDVALDPLAN